MEFLELVLGIGIIPIGTIRICGISFRILRIPIIPETELPGNADQARIPRILIISIGIILIPGIHSRNSNNSNWN